MNPGLDLVRIVQVWKISVGCSIAVIVLRRKMAGIASDNLLDTNPNTILVISYAATANPLFKATIMLVVSMTPAMPPPPWICQIVVLYYIL